MNGLINEVLFLTAIATVDIWLIALYIDLYIDKMVGL